MGGRRFSADFCAPRSTSFLDLLLWKLSPNRFRPHFREEPRKRVVIDWERIKKNGSLSVTFMRHASVMVNDHGRYLLVDPVFSGISPLIRDYSPLCQGIKGMPPPDHVLITHGHYDHLDLPSLGRLPRNTHVITPRGYDREFRKVRMRNRSQLDWFETLKFNGTTVTLVPCCHWTMRNPLRGPNRSLWGSFIIETSSGYTIFMAGDTAYFDGFREIGNTWDIDLAVFNLGAYEPRWFMKASHMDPKETVRAFQELGAEKMMICHWGTFRLGNEPVHFPPLDLKKELGRQGLPDALVMLDHGESFFPYA